MKKLNYCLPQDCKTFSSDIFSILCEADKIKKGKNIEYYNLPFVFDIEASSFYIDSEKQCVMYAWGFGVNGRCILGRTWQEFLRVCTLLTKEYKTSLNRRLVIYIHNLSYEFQWFRKYFEWENVFCLDNRKPIYALTKDGIEFRCSYLLSGYSLEKLGENLMKYKVNKKVGDLDYKLLRHTRTFLTEEEKGYILNDCLVVMAHIKEEIERCGDITKIPLTKTGYVRNLCKENCLKGEEKFEYTRKMKYLRLSINEYNQLKRGYTGGFTHANINYVDKIVYNVKSFDFASSYPAVMLSEKYPMSKSFECDIKDEEDFKNKLNAYCCLFDCTFYNLQSKVTYENYISISRCQRAEHYIVNNGRLVEADVVKIILTEQDFFIIYKLYSWDYIEISNFRYYYKDYLPKPFIETILKLYYDKTSLKGVKGKEVEYMVSKNMINSCYGMCVTDPCRDEILYNDSWEIKTPNIEDLLEKYNTNRNRVLFYPWGVWVTAYARRNLFKGIIEFGDDYIYSDTDSIKVVNYENHKDFITNYNKNIALKIDRCLSHYSIPLENAKPKNKKGEMKQMGIWEYEGEYSRFKTLGAKRYIVEKDNNIEITIAGVGKKAGIEYLKYKYKTNDEIFNNFEEDLLFPACYYINEEEKNGSGKLCHTYLDNEMSGEITDYTGNKYYYHELSGVHMENTEYRLGLDFEFKNLLQGIKGGHLC